MKKSELKIGNYITDMNAGDKFFSQVIKLDYLRCYYGYFSARYEDLKPIPLTEEWLLKFGFEYETLFDTDGGEYYSYIKGQFMLYNSEYCDVFKCDLNENYDVDVTKVHQLRNLYFALTNEELTYENLP